MPNMCMQQCRTSSKKHHGWCFFYAPLLSSVRSDAGSPLISADTSTLFKAWRLRLELPVPLESLRAQPPQQQAPLNG